MPFGPIPRNSYDHLHHGYCNRTFYNQFPTEKDWDDYYLNCCNPFTKTVTLLELLGKPNLRH